MNLHQLEYFAAVAETLNFTKAAKKCYISQTAISLQIKALEEAVGVPLFYRDKHHVELTTAGKVYLNEVRAILERSHEAIKLAQTAAEGINGSIAIGFIRGYEQSLFSETLRSFHSAYPNISIELIRDNMSSLYRKLEKGECDIVFNLFPYANSFSGFAYHFMKAFPMMAILYPGHRLSARKTLLFSDLLAEEFIVMQPKGTAVDETEEAALCYDRGGFLPNIIHREREVQTILLMVSAGMGVAVLPEYTVRYYRETKNLRIIPLYTANNTPETLDFGAAWRENNTNPAVTQMLDWLRVKKVIE